MTTSESAARFLHPPNSHRWTPYGIPLAHGPGPGTQQSAAMATAVPAAIESASVTEGPAVMSTEPAVTASGVMMARVAVMTAGLMVACAMVAGWMRTVVICIAGAVAVR